MRNEAGAEVRGESFRGARGIMMRVMEMEVGMQLCDVRLHRMCRCNGGQLTDTNCIKMAAF